MARTLTFNAQQVMQIGITYGLAMVAAQQSEARTVSSAPVIESTQDPFEVLFGRYDNDPSWEDFPKWLKEYRASRQRNLAT